MSVHPHPRPLPLKMGREAGDRPALGERKRPARRGARRFSVVSRRPGTRDGARETLAPRGLCMRRKRLAGDGISEPAWGQALFQPGVTPEPRGVTIPRAHPPRLASFVVDCRPCGRGEGNITGANGAWIDWWGMDGEGWDCWGLGSEDGAAFLLCEAGEVAPPPIAPEGGAATDRGGRLRRCLGPPPPPPNGGPPPPAAHRGGT